MGVFVILAFIFIGIIYHRRADSPALQFLAHRSTYPFYISALLTTLLILTAVWFANHSEFTPAVYLLFGAVMIGILLVAGSVSILGCKYYRSFIFFNWSKRRNSSKPSKAMSLVRLMKFGVFIIVFMVVLLSSAVYPWLYRDSSRQFFLFIIFGNSVLIIFTTIASFMSKIAQLQWYVLM